LHGKLHRDDCEHLAGLRDDESARGLHRGRFGFS
jgi:hypothetical protein